MEEFSDGFVTILGVTFNRALKQGMQMILCVTTFPVTEHTYRIYMKSVHIREDFELISVSSWQSKMPFNNTIFKFNLVVLENYKVS